MKKGLAAVIASCVVAGAAIGFFTYQYNHSQTKPVISSPMVSSSQLEQSSSAVKNSSSQQNSSAASSPAASSAAESTVLKPETERIMAAVKLDWKKYRLKAVSPKTVKDTKYNAYEIWDDDFMAGPEILVDTTSGKIYTWAPSDTEPLPVEQDKAFDKTPHTITGTMEDGAMMSLTLKTADGSQLIIHRVGVDTTGLKSMKIGDRIKVTYTGVIKGNDTSRAFITKLENA